MNVLALDTEVTIWNKGNPFDQRNKLVCVSFATENESGVYFGSYDVLLSRIRRADILVFFNAKYDLHWLRKVGVRTTDNRIWCCQLFEFLHLRQSRPYPSLGDTAERYGLGDKDNGVQQYWDKGINTDEIPVDVLSAYAVKDAELTLKIYKEQVKVQKPHQRKLFNLQMYDLLCLEEMEKNGLHFEKQRSLEKAEQLDQEIAKLQKELDLFHTVPGFNWASPDQLSALLYGGTIQESRRIPNGTYKTGLKAGETKFKIETITHSLPRLYKPIKGSELKKENKWSVEEDYLLRLKGDRALISGLLKLKELSKLKGTYFEGLPKLHSEMNWEEGIIHGSFNQCVTATGRLSSTRPNMQNIADPALELFTTRWTQTTTS